MVLPGARAARLNLALLADEESVVDPGTVAVTEAHERAVAAIEADPRNKLLVLSEGADPEPGAANVVHPTRRVAKIRTRTPWSRPRSHSRQR